MYDSVLVAVDGSDPADAAVRRAVDIASTFDASLSLLRVVDDRSFPPSLHEHAGELSLREQVDAETERALATGESLAADSDVPCEVVVRRGAPHEELTDYVEDAGSDLVAMGTHGRTGIERLVLGSVTERVLRTSDVPVLTTREASPEAVEEVLVPTDGSDCAERALEHAVALAEGYDATLHLLSVVDLQSIASAYSSGPVIPDVIDNLKRRHTEAVESAAERARARGLDPTTTVWEGTPYQALEKYVDEESIDLTVMGTHGRSGLDRHLIGSVTERVVRTSDVPVVAVPK